MYIYLLSFNFNIVIIILEGKKSLFYLILKLDRMEKMNFSNNKTSS